MTTVRLKVARIGNSRGVRIPAASLKRYRIGDAVIMEERAEGILLRRVGPTIEKLSWEDTALEMAKAGEVWDSWDSVSSDGSGDLPWASREGRVAEKRLRYVAKRVRKRR